MPQAIMESLALKFRLFGSKVKAPMSTLPGLLEATAARVPQRAAMIFDDKPLAYADLQDLVVRQARAFHSRGIRRGDCVAIVHRNSPEFVIAYYALNRLGAVTVPINFMVSKSDELAFMLNDCRAVGLVTQKEFAGNLAAMRPLVPSLRHFWTTDMPQPPQGGEDLASTRASLSTSAPVDLPAGPGPEDTACILYTSGTTGKPKGVMLSHANMASNAAAATEGLFLSERDVFLCILPMFHTFAWTACVVIPLSLGAKIVVIQSLTPPQPWLKAMAKHKVTLFAAVPQLYAVLADKAQGLKGLVLKYWYFRKVRFGVSGAAPLRVETLQAFESRLGVPIMEGYGMTETSPVTSINRPDARRIGSVGQTIRDVQVRIVGEDGNPVPVGGEGEVCVRGPNVMKGYFNNPEATAAAFTPDGWLKTGDIGVLDPDGYLSIRDRKKDMIIVKGLKVFPAMIEAELMTLDGIEEAAVIGIPGPDGDETIKAYLVLKKDAALDKAGVQKFLKEKFDPYKRPRDVEFVAALPKNALQKILKRVLRQQEIEKLQAGK